MTRFESDIKTELDVRCVMAMSIVLAPFRKVRAIELQTLARTHTIHFGFVAAMNGSPRQVPLMFSDQPLLLLDWLQGYDVRVQQVKGGKS